MHVYFWPKVQFFNFYLPHLARLNIKPRKTIFTHTTPPHPFCLSLSFPCSLPPPLPPSLFLSPHSVSIPLSSRLSLPPPSLQLPHVCLSVSLSAPPPLSLSLTHTHTRREHDRLHVNPLVCCLSLTFVCSENVKLIFERKLYRKNWIRNI